MKEPMPTRHENNGAHEAQVAVHLRDFVPEVIFFALQDELTGGLNLGKSWQVDHCTVYCDLHGTSK